MYEGVYVRVCVCVYTPSSMCYELAYRISNLTLIIDFLLVQNPEINEGP